MEHFKHHRKISLSSPWYSFKHLTFLALILSFFAILTHSYFTSRSFLYTHGKLYPMIQFDRSGFTKAEILSSSYKAIQLLSKLNRADSDDGNSPTAPFMKNVINVDDRKTRRQLLALEALGMNSKSDFQILSNLGYTPSGNVSDVISKEYFNSSPDLVGFRSPEYDKLCLNSAFTMDSPYRPVDKNFCIRLRRLAGEIVEGKEPPLLTLFTWWVDPITDGEILSRKSMMANWDILRPFVVPVVFTNSRMNMAFANRHEWPCIPVNHSNKDGLPVFEPLSRLVSEKFTSSFYGYAKPVAMFDMSLLETLLAIKNKYREYRSYVNLGKSMTSLQGQGGDSSLLIHGQSIKLPHKFTDFFVNFEHLYKFLRGCVTHRKGFSVEDSNYVIFKDIDLTSMPPLVVHDDFLFRFLVDFSLRRGHTVINASSILLAVQTFRPDHTNEWGRRYLQSKQFDPFYNRRLATTWYNENEQRSGGLKGHMSN